MLETSQILHSQDSVLDLIAPTSQMIVCRRSGNLVNTSYCIYLCETNREEDSTFNNGGGNVCCAFSYNDQLGRLGDVALAES